MKRILALTAIALMLVSATSFGQGFTVKGHIDGVEDGKIILQTRGGEKFTTGLSKGNFTLKGKVTEPNYFTLQVEGLRGGAGIFLQNTEFKLEAKKSNNGRYDVLEVVSLTGGAAQEVYQKYLDAMAGWNEEFRAETAEYMEAYRAGDEEKTKALEPVYDAADEKMNNHVM